MNMIAQIIDLLNKDGGSLKCDEALDLSCIKPSAEGFVIIQDGEVTVFGGNDKPYYDSRVAGYDHKMLSMITRTDGYVFENQRSLLQDLTFKQSGNVFTDRGKVLDEATMKSLKLIKKNGLYSNLAYLLSDQNPFIIKAAQFENGEIVKKKEFTGSILKQLYQVMAYLNGYNGNITTSQGDVTEYPEEAYMEALFNMIIHRDYKVKADGLISLYEDKTEFVNAGGIGDGLSVKDICIGVSSLKNKGLTNILYYLGFVNGQGTGMNKIFSGYDSENREPEIAVGPNSFKLTLYSRVAEQMVPVSSALSIEEEALLKASLEKGYVSRKETETILSVSQTTAGRILKRMADSYLFDTEGQGKATKYRPSEKGLRLLKAK